MGVVEELHGNAGKGRAQNHVAQSPSAPFTVMDIFILKAIVAREASQKFPEVNSKYLAAQ